MIAEPSLASEKTFLALTQTCYFAGGQVWISNNNERFYSEVLGSFNSVNTQVCGKGFFDTRTCATQTLYNFRLACKGGVATAPQLFMALFGNDKVTQQNGFTLSGNQLFYLEPVGDFSGNRVRRAALPVGYAPLHTVPIDTVARRLTWDDARDRPMLSRTPTSDQEQRIRALFNTGPGYVEPFPEVNIRKAVSISEEPPPAPPRPAPTPKSAEASLPPSQTSGIYIGANSTSAVAISTFFAGFFAWIVALVTKATAGERPSVLRHITVESIALVISGFVLHSLGIVDEVKLLSIPIGAGVSVAVISAIKFA